MIKETIKYEDYNGQEQSEDFYFNLTKLEMMEMEIDHDGGKGGLKDYIDKLTKTTAGSEAYHLFKDIILASCGQKSDDGRRFIKNDEIRTDFEQSPAMAELIFSIIQDGEKAARFVRGILPAKMVEEAEAEAARDRAEGKTPADAPVAPAPESRKIDAEQVAAMTDEELGRVAASRFTQDGLVAAFQRKNQQ